MPKLNYDRAANLLAEAAMFGDMRTADKNGITVQTLRNYRKRLDAGDNRLMQLLGRATAVLKARWADRLVPAILDAVDYIQCAVAAAKADPVTLKNPDMLHSVNGSMKLLAEVAMSERMLDARLAGSAAHVREEAGSLAADEEGGEVQH